MSWRLPNNAHALYLYSWKLLSSGERKPDMHRVSLSVLLRRSNSRRGKMHGTGVLLRCRHSRCKVNPVFKRCPELWGWTVLP